MICYCSISEYACPVFYSALLQYLSNNMNRLKKRVLHILYPDLSYTVALVATSIASLYKRRQALSEALFDQIMVDRSRTLHELLPPCNKSTYCTQNRGNFTLPICKTYRFRDTLIMKHSF